MISQEARDWNICSCGCVCSQGWAPRRGFRQVANDVTRGVTVIKMKTLLVLYLFFILCSCVRFYNYAIKRRCALLDRTMSKRTILWNRYFRMPDKISKWVRKTLSFKRFIVFSFRLLYPQYLLGESARHRAWPMAARSVVHWCTEVLPNECDFNKSCGEKRLTLLSLLTRAGGTCQPLLFTACSIDAFKMHTWRGIANQLVRYANVRVKRSGCRLRGLRNLGFVHVAPSVTAQNNRRANTLVPGIRRMLVHGEKTNLVHVKLIVFAITLQKLR